MTCKDSCNCAQNAGGCGCCQQQQPATWRNDPIWGGWSTYQGADLTREGTVKIPESKYRQFVAWKEFLEARKRFLDLLRIDVENQMQQRQNFNPQNQFNFQRPPFPPNWGPYPNNFGQFPPGCFQGNPWMQYGYH